MGEAEEGGEVIALKAAALGALLSGAAFGQTSVMQQSGFLDGQKFNCETYRAVLMVPTTQEPVPPMAVSPATNVTRVCVWVEKNFRMGRVAAYWRNHRLLEITCSYYDRGMYHFTPRQCIAKLNSFPRR